MTAAAGALGFSLISTGTFSGDVAHASPGQVAALSDGTPDRSGGPAVFRDASAIQTLNDPLADVVDATAASPHAAAAVAEARARAQALLAAAQREAQAAAAQQAGSGATVGGAAGAQLASDDGLAGPDAYRAYARGKVGAAQFGCLDSLWKKESGWRPNARNPNSTAYGIPQLLRGTWAATGIAPTSNGYRQVDAGLVYIAAAYGSPCAAWSHSQAIGWY